MAKRFISTDIWLEDWFLDIPNDYKLFWFYMITACNHAGFFRVNIKQFNQTVGCSINPTKAVEYFNNGKQRIKVVRDGIWFLEDFILFQYGSKLNKKNRAHLSVLQLLNSNNINPLSVRGLIEVIDRSN